MSDDAIRTYVALASEEYKTLRDESKQASINMWTAMQWGSALVGITIGVGLSQWNAPNPATALAFDVVVPTFSALTMAFWLGEAARFKRVGDYLCLIEQKLSLLLDEHHLIPEVLRTRWPQLQRDAELALHLRRTDTLFHEELILRDPLSWEQWLRRRKGRSVIDGHLSKLYAIRLGFFLVLSWGSWVFGLLYTFTSSGSVTLHRSMHVAALGTGLLMCLAATIGAVVVGIQLNKTVQPIERSGSV